MRPASLILLVIAGVLALGIAATSMFRSSEAAGAALLHPSSQCDVGMPSITLAWNPVVGAKSQRIEYSVYDNGFAEAFETIQVDADASTHTMTPIQTDVPNYWRVVSTTAVGEVASDAGVFMPCGGPMLLWGPMECSNTSSASVSFRWAPLANYGGDQFIEIDYDADFAGEDVMRIGPLSPSLQGLKRGGFHTGQTYAFRIVRQTTDGTSVATETGWFTPDCAAPQIQVNPELYGSDDRLILPSIGVDAPINVRDVGYDGALGVPAGGYDVVRYNFDHFPELASQPGGPGTVVVGGHYDYHVIGPAIFWNLKTMQPGDVIDYWDGEIKYTYVVDWVTNLPFDEGLNPYVDQAGPGILLITCNGEFDRGLYGGYNLRTLVHGVLVQ